jgi:hypothetical protein
MCQNVSIWLDNAGNASTTAAAINNNSVDICGIIDSISLSKTNFNCTDTGANTVILTVTDDSGNTATCTATVTVVDAVQPVALCKNATVFLDASGQASLTAGQVDNGSSDACGIAMMSVSPSSFSCANIGNNPVTLTVQDVNGNVKTCAALVTVADNLPPMPVCQDINLPLEGYTVLSPAQVLNATASFDNCGTVTPLSVTPNQFNCINDGANPVVLTVTDGHGNTATCQAVVTVIAPAFSVEVTPENCNSSDGSIVVTVTGGGSGQPAYSLNGGQSYQFGNVFSGLSAGSYPIVVAYFGGSGCTLPLLNVPVSAIGEVTNTWNGNGDGSTWSDGKNWSVGFVPLACHDVIIPAGHAVLVPAGVTALGRTLFVDAGSDLTMEPNALMQIEAY